MRPFANLIRDKKTFLIYSLLFLFAVFALFKPPIDPDFGWHYKYGEYMVANHKIPRENTFSYTFPDYQWANSYWLSEVIFYLLYSNFGAVGMVVILGVVLSLLIIFIFSRLEGILFGKALGIMLTICLLSVYLVVVRPMYFSSVFLLFLTYILLYRKSLMKFLPLVFLVWANMHADFALGLFILGVFCAFELFVRGEKMGKKVINFILIPILCVLATLVNPYGVGLWQTLLKEIHFYQFSHIGEWTPVGVDNPLFFSFFVFLLALLISASWWMRKKYGWWYFVVSVFFFLLSLRSQYFMRPFLLVGILAVSNFWGLQIKGLVLSVSDSVRTKLVFAGRFYVLLALITVLPVFFESVWKALDIRRWSGEDYPYEAISYIRKNPLKGNMFNDYGWGGYLIWQLPEYETFIDGRMTSWREDGYGLIEEYMDFVSDPLEKMELLDKYDVGWVLTRKDSKVASQLIDSTKWTRIYSGGTDTIFLRLKQ